MELTEDLVLELWELLRVGEASIVLKVVIQDGNSLLVKELCYILILLPKEPALKVLCEFTLNLTAMWENW